MRLNRTLLTHRIVLIGLLLILVAFLGPGYSVAEEAAVCPTVTQTSQKTVVYGDITWNGSPIPIGTVVTIKNPTGVVVGCQVTTTSGIYSLMYAYGAEQVGDLDLPGMRVNEILAFEIDGLSAFTDPEQPWSNDWQSGSPHKVNLVGPRPAAVQNLGIVSTANVVSISWDPVTQDHAGNAITVDHYEVYRSTDPYFGAYQSDFLGQSSSFSFADDLSAFEGNAYYAVRAVKADGTIGADSVRVGRFTFGLVPGD